MAGGLGRTRELNFELTSRKGRIVQPKIFNLKIKLAKFNAKQTDDHWYHQKIGLQEISKFTTQNISKFITSLE